MKEQAFPEWDDLARYHLWKARRWWFNRQRQHRHPATVSPARRRKMRKR